MKFFCWFKRLANSSNIYIFQSIFSNIFYFNNSHPMTGWRNVWSIKLRVQDQGEGQRRPGKRLYVRTVKHVSWIKRMPWTVTNGEIKEARWSGWVWVGEWYRPTRVVPDQRPLNGRCCSGLVVQVVSALLLGSWQYFNWHNASRGPSAIAELLCYTCVNFLLVS